MAHGDLVGVESSAVAGISVQSALAQELGVAGNVILRSGQSLVPSVLSEAVAGTDVAADGAELTEGDRPDHVAVVIVTDQDLVAGLEVEQAGGVVPHLVGLLADRVGDIGIGVAVEDLGGSQVAVEGGHTAAVVAQLYQPSVMRTKEPTLPSVKAARLPSRSKYMV